MKAVRLALVLVVVAVAGTGAPRAEVVEEIIAWVDGDIVTRSEYEAEKEGRVADIYRRFSGEELDRELERTRESILISMIDRKILLHHAEALGYNMEKMSDAYLQGFMEEQDIASEDELRSVAESNGMTLKEIRDRLMELYGPQDVIDMEVAKRISVSDAELEDFHAENQDPFRVEGEVTLREIVLLGDSPATRDARREEARAIRERLLAGEDFAAMAKEVSEAGTASNGGKFGPFKRSEIAEALAGPAFELPVGSISELMETPYGFHIVKVESRMDDHIRTLDDVRDEVRRQLRDSKFRDALEEFMKKARAESEWCVKLKHVDLLSIESPPTCERM